MRRRPMGSTSSGWGCERFSRGRRGPGSDAARPSSGRAGDSSSASAHGFVSADDISSWVSHQGIDRLMEPKRMLLLRCRQRRRFCAGPAGDGAGWGLDRAGVAGRLRPEAPPLHPAAATGQVSHRTAQEEASTTSMNFPSLLHRPLFCPSMQRS